MKKVAWTVAVVILLASCHGVVRDENTYKAEVGFMNAAALQEADSIVYLVKSGCKCEGGKFVLPECEKAAHRAMVVQSRVPWHTAMMLYNARLLDERPSVDPPAIPTSTTLCQ